MQHDPPAPPCPRSMTPRHAPGARSDMTRSGRFSHFGVEPEYVPALAVKATLSGGALVEIAVLRHAAGETDA